MSTFWLIISDWVFPLRKIFDRSEKLKEKLLQNEQKEEEKKKKRKK